MSSKQKGKKKEEEENVKVVLQIDMHCDCKNCFKRISKCTQDLHGIKSMNIEETEMKFKVTVTGKVEPSKLQQKFQKKLKKPVELISPKPNKEKEISKKIMLEINMGCDKCVENMQKIITKTKGFQGIFIDRSKNLVTVDGEMDIECLVKELKEKLKKSVKIIQKEKKEENVKPMCWCPNFHGYYGSQYCDCFVLECIWCPKIHGYGPEYCDRFVYREAEYCRIM
ncbi:PREDICTED: heavy metal-associated isoprenylated plant protein 3-like [Nicotiana attenuata]|uniref:Heavy metal-associated isoprenylated plant protein 3 n=1 Tax=Nicotiana attenuata TaxID=49451 RepID=A0A1J6K683_NICAT|nr:PREDICTED: heavy metal-associated isoprenylated plant protein 3-like [Nicotiana attenuata]OIT20536.1 heavy metal-associated isoprenylated plant protein 3 [Nicotiana attenuata]